MSTSIGQWGPPEGPEDFTQVFERYDAILTPATAGEAPAGLESTGSPAFCTLWTLCGLPAVSLPLLEGPSGLPLVAAPAAADSGSRARSSGCFDSTGRMSAPIR